MPKFFIYTILLALTNTIMLSSGNGTITNRIAANYTKSYSKVNETYKETSLNNNKANPELQLKTPSFKSKIPFIAEKRKINKQFSFNHHGPIFTKNIRSFLRDMKRQNELQISEWKISNAGIRTDNEGNTILYLKPHKPLIKDTQLPCSRLVRNRDQYINLGPFSPKSKKQIIQSEPLLRYAETTQIMSSNTIIPPQILTSTTPPNDQVDLLISKLNSVIAVFSILNTTILSSSTQTTEISVSSRSTIQNNRNMKSGDETNTPSIMVDVLERVKQLEMRTVPKEKDSFKTGSWSSTSSGVLIHLSGAFNSLEVSLSPKSPPGEGFLVDPEWKAQALRPFEKSPMVVIVATKEIGKQVAVFIGECRVCGEKEIISGNWLVARLARNCEDERASQDLIGDVWRREMLTHLRIQRLKELESKKQNGNTIGSESLIECKAKRRKTKNISCSSRPDKIAPTIKSTTTQSLKTNSKVHISETRIPSLTTDLQIGTTHTDIKTSTMYASTNALQNKQTSTPKSVKPVKKAFKHVGSQIKKVFRKRTTVPTDTSKT